VELDESIGGAIGSKSKSYFCVLIFYIKKPFCHKLKVQSISYTPISVPLISVIFL
jgi:hypothetical protein